MYIKAVIQNVEYNTELDENIMSFLQGTLYKKDEQYYLYCESILLNNKVFWGGTGEYSGDLPTEKEVTEDTIDNFDEDVRKWCPDLGNEPTIPRKIIQSITPLPLDKLAELFISEIKQSKVDIGNAIIIEKEDYSMRFEGHTYGVNIHNCTLCDKYTQTINLNDDEYWLKVNPTDQVLYQKTDRRGYPASCGAENKEKDVIVIVKGPVPKPELGKVRDLSKGE